MKTNGTCTVSASMLEDYPEYVHAIGMVSIEMSGLEYLLGELLAALLRVNKDVGQILYLTPQSSIGRLSILENYATHALIRENAITQAIFEIIKKAKKYIGQRHQIIHELWGVSFGDIKRVMRHTMPRLETTNARVIPIGELKTLVHNMQRLKYEVEMLTIEISTELPPRT